MVWLAVSHSCWLLHSVQWHKISSSILPRIHFSPVPDPTPALRNLFTLNAILWPWPWMTLSTHFSQAWIIIHSSTHYELCSIFMTGHLYKQNTTQAHRCSWSVLQLKSRPCTLRVCCSTPHTICNIYLITTHGWWEVPKTVTLQLPQKLALLQGRVTTVHNNNQSLQIISQNKYQLH